MRLYENDTITVFFGDKSTSVYPDQVRGKLFKNLGQTEENIKKIRESLPPTLETIVAAHQVHGISGFTVTDADKELPFFTEEGDYLVTALPNMGLAVATADCLPIVFYDPVQRVIAVVHAGWRGLVGGVVEQALEDLLKLKGSIMADVRCLVGPAARVCCYEVGQDFVEQAGSILNLVRRPLLQNTIECRYNKYFFDTALFLRLLLYENGLRDGFFDTSYNECTICEERCCSYRREKMSPLRQLTVVSLK